MKASRTLKRHILLAAAAILTVAMLTSVAVTFVFAANTPVAAISQYQVSMNGNLNLRFIYNSVSNVTGFKAEVCGNSYNYTLEEVKSGDKYIVAVPLAPSEIAADVTVTPMNGGTAGEAITYSVEKYAKRVISSTDGDDDTMRALLNWGNHSNVKFDQGKAQITDIFTRNSDPISAVKSIDYKGHDPIEYGASGLYTNGILNLALDRNNIILSFYLDYSGEGTLKAHLTREAAGEAAALDKDVAIEHVEGDKYRVSVKNVSVNLFNALYTLTVDDGTNEFVASTSVLEYLSAIVADANGEYDAPTENTARSLYQFYQLATGDVDAECTHTVDAHYCENDASSDAIKCSTCFAKLDTVADSVNYFNHASDIVDPYEATREYMYDAEAGIAYSRIATKDKKVSYIALTHGNGGYGKTTSELHKPGKYLVMYHRIVNTTDSEKFFLNVGHSKTVNDNLQEGRTPAARGLLGAAAASGSEARYNSLISKVTNWQMTVIDLEQSTHSGYSYPVGAEEDYSLFYQLQTIGSGSLTIDIAYIATVDSLDELAGLPYTDTVANKCHVITTFKSGEAVSTLIPGMPCDNHIPNTALVKNGTDTVYTTKCTVCGYTMTTQTVGADVNYFNHGVDICKNLSSGMTREYIIDNDTGIPFIRIDAKRYGDKKLGRIISLTNSASGLQFNNVGDGIASSALSTAEKYEPGRYLVMYHRVDPSIATTVGKFWIWAGHSDTVSSTMSDSTTRSKNPGGEPRYNGLIKTVTDWQMTVIDLSEWNYGADGSGYPENSETEYSLFFALQTDNGDVMIDIAYIATVDSLDELAGLPGAEAVNNNYHLVTTWKSGAAVETPIPTGEE